MPDHASILIQQALEDLARFQGYRSAAVDALDRLRVERDRYREALEKLARLGNGNELGNSIGNTIARDALGI